LTGRRRASASGRLAAAIALSIACHLGLILASSYLLGGGASAPAGSRFVVSIVELREDDGRAGGAGAAGPPLRVPEEAAALAAPGIPSASRRDSPAPRAVTAANAVRDPARARRPGAAAPPAAQGLARADPSFTAAPGAGRRGDAVRAARDAERTPDSDVGAASRDPGEAHEPTSATGAATVRAGDAADLARTDANTGVSDHAADVARGSSAADLRAWCRSCPVPEYPARARRHGWQGTVDVDLELSGDGTVTRASVGRSSGVAVLDAAAVAVARRSRFLVPSGQPRQGQLRYRFLLESTL
jgi:TonB family protein